MKVEHVPVSSPTMQYVLTLTEEEAEKLAWFLRMSIISEESFTPSEGRLFNFHAVREARRDFYRDLVSIPHTNPFPA